MTASFHSLLTHHNGTVCVDTSSGTLVGCNQDQISSGLRPVLLCWSGVRPQECFLVADTVEPIRVTVSHDALFGTVVPVQICAAPDGATASLFHSWTGRWLTAAPHSVEAPGLVAAHAFKVQEFERFQCSPFKPHMIRPNLLEMAREFDWLLGPDFSTAELGQRLAEPSFLAALEAAAQVWPQDRLSAVVDAFVSQPGLSASLAAAAPDDLFARTGLPELTEMIRTERRASAPAPRTSSLQTWLSRLGRKPPMTPTAFKLPIAGSTTLPAEMDSLANAGFDGQPTSFAHRLTLLTRSMVLPTKDFCIVATARNEGLYILDWVAYHRSIGLRDIFLYTNDNDDGSDALLLALSNAGVLRWRNSQVAPGGNAQNKAYGHAFQISPELMQYRWVLVIDLDEFLGFDSNLFPRLADFIDWQERQEVDAITFNWVIHGSSQQGRWRDEFMPTRFPAAAETANAHIKTMFRPGRFVHSTPHHPVAPGSASRTYRSASGALHAASEAGVFSHSYQPNVDKAWISHFFYRSTEEYLLKWSRNRGDFPTQAGATTNNLTAQFIHNFMAQFDVVAPHSSSILPCAPGFVVERERIEMLPGVAAAFLAIKAQHRRRMPVIEALFKHATGIREAGETGKRLLATLH